MITRIIRTREELTSLDPDTLLYGRYEGYDSHLNVADLQYLNGTWRPEVERALPAVVIATGDTVRAARQALKEPDPAPALPDGWRLADHNEYGRVVVTNSTPNPDGNVHVVIPDPGNITGYDWGFCTPDKLTYLDTGQEDDQ